MQPVEHRNATGTGRDFDDYWLIIYDRHVAKNNVIAAFAPRLARLPTRHSRRAQRSKAIRAAAKSEKTVLFGTDISVSMPVKVEVVPPCFQAGQSNEDIASVWCEKVAVRTLGSPVALPQTPGAFVTLIAIREADPSANLRLSSRPFGTSGMPGTNLGSY